MNAIETLVNEHKNIKKLVESARAMCGDIIEGKEVPCEDLHCFIALARAYADKHHHGKEEQILFRVMAEKLSDKVEGLDKILEFGMLFDHTRGRMYLLELEQALRLYAKAPSTRLKVEIVSNAAGWAHLLAQHMVKEDNAAYRLASVHFDAETMAQVEAEFERFETEHAVEREETLAKLLALTEKYMEKC